MLDTMAENPRTKSRNSALTRAAILSAARECFAAADYEHVTVREIAGKAGVNAALINRYFGNKETLFRKALETGEANSPDRLAKLKELFVDRTRFGERLAKLVLSERRDRSVGDPMLILLRSVGQPDAESVVRDRMQEWLEPLATLIGGEDGLLRAEMILALLAGLDLFRNVIRSAGVSSADDDVLITLLGGALQAQITI